MIAGLEDITSGDIRIGEGRQPPAPARPRYRHGIPNYALYQHMSVYDNLAFGLRNKKTLGSRIKAAIDRAAGMPWSARPAAAQAEATSAVQQERWRWSMHRTAIRKVSFDEPLSNLDAKLRAQMRSRSKRRMPKINHVVFVITTSRGHDAGHRCIMRDGRIQQIGTPLQVYGKARQQSSWRFHRRAAMNFIDVTCTVKPAATAVEGPASD